MIELVFTKEPKWLDKWDEFLLKNPKSSHLIYTDWLKSYKSYGFDYELGILLDNNKIVGGFGAVIPKFLFFKFYIIPHGPIFSEGYSHKFKDCIVSLKLRAKSLKCCYIQFSVPISSNSIIATQTYLPEQVEISNTGFKLGKLFNYIYCSYGLNWLNLKDVGDENDLLKDLDSHARRNIRTAYKSDLVLVEATTDDLIKKAYELVVLNAVNSGYSVRAFEEIKQTITHLIRKDKAVFIMAYKDDQIKGSAFFIENYKSLTYIFGGTLKEKPDLRVGYFLHWEAIKKAIEKDYLGYNISMGGSKGVLRFKSQFYTQEHLYESPNYYSIVKPFYFKLFKLFNTYLKPYKSHVSKLLARIKR